jgi:hypothetical protein
MGAAHAEYKLWVPSALGHKLVWHAHTNYGHCGAHKTIDWIKEKYFWKGMGRDVRRLLRSCDTCQRTKYPNKRYEGPMENIIPARPRDLCAVDLYGPLPRAKFKNRYVFVSLDVFSKLVQVYPLNKPTAKNCIRVLKNEYFKLCGVPRRILSDHGTQFTSALWKESMEEMGVKVIYSSIRRPQTNPSERVMRELSRVFRVYCSDDHKRWPEVLLWINRWFHEVTHESTGMTPTEVHFGRKPERVDLSVEFPEPTGWTTRDVQQITLRALEKSGRRRKAHQKSRGYKFSVGDRVLLRSPKTSDTRASLFHKFFHLYTGPFKISKWSGPNSCYLSDDAGSEVGVHNFGNLKPNYSPHTHEISVLVSFCFGLIEPQWLFCFAQGAFWFEFSKLRGRCFHFFSPLLTV